MPGADAADDQARVGERRARRRRRRPPAPARRGSRRRRSPPRRRRGSCAPSAGSPPADRPRRPRRRCRGRRRRSSACRSRTRGVRLRCSPRDLRRQRLDAAERAERLGLAVDRPARAPPRNPRPSPSSCPLPSPALRRGRKPRHPLKPCASRGTGRSRGPGDTAASPLPCGPSRIFLDAIDVQERQPESEDRTITKPTPGRAAPGTALAAAADASRPPPLPQRRQGPMTHPLDSPSRRRLLLALALLPATRALAPPAWAQEAAGGIGLITSRVCMVAPELTEGPFYIDPELVRSDITEGRPGAPMELALQVVTADCAPVAGRAGRRLALRSPSATTRASPGKAATPSSTPPARPSCAAPSSPAPTAWPGSAPSIPAGTRGGPRTSTTRSSSTPAPR